MRDPLKNPNFTIFGNPDTNGERYATENGFKFVDLTAPDDSSSTPKDDSSTIDDSSSNTDDGNSTTDNNSSMVVTQTITIPIMAIIQIMVQMPIMEQAQIKVFLQTRLIVLQTQAPVLFLLRSQVSHLQVLLQ